MVGFAFLQPTLFLATISCHTTLSFLLQSCLPRSYWASLGLPFIFLPMAQYDHCSFFTSLAGSCVPFVFPWACRARLLSLALFLTLHSHRLLLNSLGFPGPITLSLILRVYGFAINPLLSLLSLLWSCRGPFSLFHIIYCLWSAFFLFTDSFKLIYLLKAHLFISWACDPLFLSLGLNGFSIYLLTLFCSCCWASPFHLGFQNGHQHYLTYFFIIIYGFYYIFLVLFISFIVLF